MGCTQCEEVKIENKGSQSRPKKQNIEKSGLQQVELENESNTEHEGASK